MDSPATRSQLRYLRILYDRDNIAGQIPANLNEFSASELLDAIKTKREITDKQRNMLLYMKVPYSAMPKTFAAAHTKINELKLARAARGPR